MLILSQDEIVILARSSLFVCYLTNINRILICTVWSKQKADTLVFFFFSYFPCVYTARKWHCNYYTQSKHVNILYFRRVVCLESKKKKTKIENRIFYSDFTANYKSLIFSLLFQTHCEYVTRWRGDCVLDNIEINQSPYPAPHTPTTFGRLFYFPYHSNVSAAVARNNGEESSVIKKKMFLKLLSARHTLWG